MTTKRAVFSLLVAALSVHLRLSGQSLGAGRFPLMAWDYVDHPKVLESMHDCGINSVAFVRPRLLDVCQRFDSLTGRRIRSIP